MMRAAMNPDSYAVRKKVTVIITMTAAIPIPESWCVTWKRAGDTATQMPAMKKSLSAVKNHIFTVRSVIRKTAAL